MRILSIVLFLLSFIFTFAQPVIKFEDAKHNYGFVSEGEQLVHEFKFQNTGNQPLVITETKVACSCTKVEFPKQPVKAGESGIIKVTFDTNNKYDRQDREVEIYSNATISPAKVRFKCIVKKKKAVEKK